MLARLTQARQCRCFVLIGPAGYGKTTTLAKWCRAMIPLGYDVAWLTLAPEDDRLPTWLSYLTSSISRVSPAIARDTEQLGGFQGGEEALERTIVALVRGIARHRRELLLVFDDIHHVKDASILSALQSLINYAPPNLHFAFSSRSPLPFPLERERAENGVCEIGASELRFSAEESALFLSAQLGSIDSDSAHHLHVLTDGWAAGLQVFSVAWKRRRRGAPTPGAASAFFQKQLRDSRAFAVYFEQEVLQRLAPEELDLLIRVSACDRFCAALCAALLDNPGARDVSNELLARLEADNLFISTVDRNAWETWYGLHPLLRESLSEHFAAWDYEAQRKVHAIASRWFRAHGHVDEAIHHALRAGEPEQAAAMVEQCAQTLFVLGDRAKLMHLVRELPAAQVEASVRLRTWMARMQIYWREFVACAATLDALDADVPADDACHRFTIDVLRAALAVQRDNVQAVEALGARFAAPPVDADPALAAGGRLILTWLAMRRGEYQRARDLQFDAPVTVIDDAPLVGSIVGSLYGRCFAGLAYALEGSMTQAEQVYRAVLRDADMGGKVCAEPANLAAALLGEVLVERNDNRTARDLLEERADVYEQVSMPDCVLRVMTTLSAAHWNMGLRSSAIGYLERLEKYARHLELDRPLAHSLALQVTRLLANGEMEAAHARLEQLAELDARHFPDSPAEFYSELHVAAHGTQVRWCLATGDIEQAARYLSPLIDYCRSHGRQRDEVALLMQHAVVLARLGRVAAARGEVLEALQRGHRLGLVRTLVDADPNAAALLGEIAQDRAAEPVVAFYAERILSRIAANDARTPLAGGANIHPNRAARDLPKFSQRETDVVRLLVEAFTAKKIARALGLSPETVKWHLANIYGKLGVSGRDAALDRLRDIDWGSGPGVVRAKFDTKPNE
ncbi:LuxR C-terminal-related transcriptional regulator [Paraburkholderia caffeinitolerans]|nr:LuxR C-terminal-related transcriptional regulator [Paraburkholderia caffeinitolerans]